MVWCVMKEQSQVRFSTKSFNSSSISFSEIGQDANAESAFVYLSFVIIVKLYKLFLEIVMSKW